MKMIAMRSVGVGAKRHPEKLAATDVHGAALDLNRADGTFMNHRGVLFATDARLAEGVRACIVP